MLEYSFNGESIIFNNFTRHYKTKNCDLIPEKKYFDSMDQYLDYILGIDYINKAYYNITKMCNLNCDYCYSKKQNKFVSLENNTLILSWLKKMKTKQLVIIGGEPFCHPDLTSIIDCALEYFEDITIVTNGTLITNDFTEHIRQKPVSLQISLDGYDEYTNSKTRGSGTFSRVKEMFTLLDEKKIKFSVMSVLTSSTIEYSFEFYKHFKNQNINAGFFMVKQVDSTIKPSLNQLEKLLSQILNEEKDIYKVYEIVKFADNMLFNDTGYPITHCGAGINAISVDSNGDVFPCVKMMSRENQITNILNEESESDICFLDNRKRIIKTDLVHQSKAECENCNIMFFCGGGCRAEEENGQICKCNCNYFHFAIEFFAKNIIENKANIKIK
ncbi:MAG: radical SAM protein [Defluviitaleaceae bacterium]|nr:radical SAM protein [Defluviitaleaceae bacterium]